MALRFEVHVSVFRLQSDRIHNEGFKVRDLGFKNLGVRYRFKDHRVRDPVLGFRIHDSGVLIEGSRLRFNVKVYDLGLRV